MVRLDFTFSVNVGSGWEALGGPLLRVMGYSENSCWLGSISRGVYRWPGPVYDHSLSGYRPGVSYYAPFILSHMNEMEPIVLDVFSDLKVKELLLR